MDCPVCKEVMVVLELDEVEIDYCANCGGIWLDSGELELLFDDAKDINKVFDTFVDDPSHHEKPYKCPICFKRMEKCFVGDTQNIMIDRCKNNDGLWFDKGELNDVLKLGSAGEKGKVFNLLKEMFANKISSNNSE